jgi:hypothetical protein
VKDRTFGYRLRIPHLYQQAIELYFDVTSIVDPEPKPDLL